ncbi:acyltransferase family protein [Streptomyces acidiscabies]|uniref:Acyltransferase n=1 Tax=Streptomyces acidiscabies TaxID=42234 RepID=A0AAP6BAB0_9ACTN|nr:acyltransferase [Streptomyces acidiscabies]MBP5937588.1 acyltransferase [Streptomyces sp. LBUM 1476]MBZ3914319.1 acyltransferase [Streptomyces acidiscabies]MDX2960953.1 acyltransferase [Streptomyces acidiscabies]MDX3017010.1 acyltransferase [Streptomyces acidiscabies]MDX3788961.1 acyltransferase [Streptomyces acidiscabies]
MTGLTFTQRSQPSVSVPVRRPRLYVLDGLRLLAALFVALHHFAGTARADRPGNPIWDRPVSEIMPNVFRVASYGWIGVEIFFVISGFVICMSCWGRTPRQFFVSRVIRLYPAYWFAILFTTGVLAAFPGVWERLAPREVLVNLTMLQSGSRVGNVDGVYWTLWAELRFYLLFLVVVAVGLSYRRVVLFCCLWGAAAMLAPSAGWPLFSLIANPDGAWYFIAGLALYLMYRFGQDLLLWGILGMAWLMGQQEIGHRIDNVEGVSGWRGAVLIFTVFLLVMVAIALGKLDRVRGKWLVTAGAITYPLYLLHYAAGTTLISRLRDDLDARLLICVVLAGFMVLSWGVHRVVERPLAGVIKRGLDSSFARLKG